MKAVKRTFALLLLAIPLFSVQGQSLAKFADSIRVTYQIPELCYAVVSSDTIFDIQFLGVRKSGTSLKAKPNDRFRIGSNTKGITSFIAAQLIKKGLIKWDTKFFDLFPDLKQQSNGAYYNITLLDLLSFRAPMVHYTYTDKNPTIEEIEGKVAKSESEARFAFVKWALRQKRIKESKEFYFSNPSYSVACLMLEKASGKTYEELVQDLNTQLGISFGFGSPNQLDTMQTWGHAEGNITEPLGNNFKLNWLMAAGNINVTLNDYSKFVQLQLLGLGGKSKLLSASDFYLLHYGKPKFALGWFCDLSNSGHLVSHNMGNPGFFMTSALVIKDIDRAYIVFTNAQNPKTQEGIELLLNAMKKEYGD